MKNSEEICLDLGGQFLGLGLLELVDLGLRLVAEAGTSPVFADLISAVVEVRLDGLDQLGESGAISGFDVSDGQTGASLPASDAAETSLVLDDAIRDSHLAAQGGEEENELDGVDVVGDEDELSLLLFDEGRDGVYSLTDDGGALGRLILLSGNTSFSAFAETLLLLLLGLGTVLVQKLEQLGSCLSVQRGLELVDCRRDLQAGLENGLLALETDVLGPFHEAAQIALGLDILTDTEVTGALLEEGVGHSLDLGLLDGQRGCCHLLSLLLTLLLNHGVDMPLRSLRF